MKELLKKKINIHAWLFVGIMVVLYESFLHLGTIEEFVPSRYIVVLLFSMGFASVLGLVLSFFPHKMQKNAALVITFVLAVLYIVQYFIHDAYQVFMPFDGILNGAGNVATNYLDVVVNLLLHNLWKIILLLLPILLFGKFANAVQTKIFHRLCLWILAVSMYAAGFGMMFAFDLDTDKFNVSTSFDSTVTSFGLHMGISLDLLGGNAEEYLQFDISFEEIPKATEEPTQPPTEEGAVSEETVPEETVPETEPPRVYQPHSLGLDFEALAEKETASKIAAVHRYMASQTPAMENEYTGMFEGKNLIIITAEAFSPYVIDSERTPTLYRMMTEGIYFTDYYQPTWGAGTTGGEYSNLLSLIPFGSTKSMQEVVEQNIFHTMGKQLQAQGYSSAAFHNNDYTYYSRHQTHTYLGYDVFIGEGNGMEEGVVHTWPQSDEAMFRYTIPQYIDQQPFSLYYMTVSGHATYTYDSNMMAQKNWSYVEDLECSDVVKSYLACNMELEHSMAYLLEQLEEKGIMDDTVVVISPDHYPYGLAPSETWSTKRDYLKELYGQSVSDCFIRDKNALIIWSGCLEDMDLQIDEPTMSLDILPTLSNLFGVKYDSRLMCGRDVFSDQDPLVFWVDGSWKTEMGSYNGYKGKFTPAEGVELEDQKEYINTMRSIVKNKNTFSQAVTFNNYFNYINAALDEMNASEETIPEETTSVESESETQEND